MTQQDLAYELGAWNALQEAKAARPTERARQLVPDAAKRQVVKVSEPALAYLRSAPGADLLLAAVTRSLDGAFRLTSKSGTLSLGRRRIIRSYAKRGHAVTELGDIRDVPLSTVDKVKPSALDLSYSVVAGLSGAGSAAAVTGAQLLATVGSVASAGAAAAPGAGVVASAIAGDAALTLTALQRGLAHVAAYYGYDVRRPEERLYALQVLSASIAEGGAKAAAYGQLSRLTQELARRATWKQLEEHVLTRVTQAVFKKLGLRLTQRKLGQVVPVAGIALGAGMNARLLDRAMEEFDLLYRERFLVDRHGPTGPVGARAYDGATGEGDDDWPSVLDVLDAEIVDDKPAPEEQDDDQPGEDERDR